MSRIFAPLIFEGDRLAGPIFRLFKRPIVRFLSDTQGASSSNRFAPPTTPHPPSDRLHLMGDHLEPEDEAWALANLEEGLPLAAREGRPFRQRAGEAVQRFAPPLVAGGLLLGAIREYYGAASSAYEQGSALVERAQEAGQQLGDYLGLDEPTRRPQKV